MCSVCLDHIHQYGSIQARGKDWELRAVYVRWTRRISEIPRRNCNDVCPVAPFWKTISHLQTKAACTSKSALKLKGIFKYALSSGFCIVLATQQCVTVLNLL